MQSLSSKICSLLTCSRRGRHSICSLKSVFWHGLTSACSLIIEQAHTRENSRALLSLWSKMLEAEITPNATSYEILIVHLTKEENLEMALTILTEMEKRDLSPSTETAESLVGLAARQGNLRLALDLATSYEAVSTRPLSTAIWVHVLASCAEYLFVSQDHRMASRRD